MTAHGGSFDRNNPTYKCCCSKCPATTGVMVGGGLQLMLVALNVVVTLEDFAEIDGLIIALDIALDVLTVISVGCAFFGLYSGIATFLIPHMTLLAFEIFILFFGGLTLIIVISAGTKNEEWETVISDTGLELLKYNDHIVALVLVLGVAFLVFGVLYVWMFLICLAAYGFLRDKALAARDHPMVVMPTAVAPTYYSTHPVHPYAVQQYASPVNQEDPPPSYDARDGNTASPPSQVEKETTHV